MTYIYTFFSILFLIALGGCDKKKEILEGDRQEVFRSIHAIRHEMTRDIRLASPIVQDWPMSGGNAAHHSPVLNVSPNMKEIWRFSMDRGASSDSRLLNGPIIAHNTVFTMDADGDVYAIDLQTGTLRWSTQTCSHGTQAFGGGLAYHEGRLFVVTALAEVMAIDAHTGSILWRQSVSAPIRSTPTVDHNRLYVTSINNQLDVFECSTGHILWSHMGITENAGILGGSSPAVKDGIVVAPYSSGEVFGLRHDTGMVLWSESLAALNRVDSISSLAHIKARPLIHKDKALVISHSGRTSLIHLRTGQTLWTKDIGGIHSPALSKGTVFMVNNNNQLIALDFETGRIIWSKNLPLTQGLKQDGERLLWAGPILTKEYLILAGSNGKIIFCSPKNGDIHHVVTHEHAFLLSPIGIGTKLIMVSNQGDVIAYE